MAAFALKQQELRSWDRDCGTHKGENIYNLVTLQRKFVDPQTSGNNVSNSQGQWAPL